MSLFLLEELIHVFMDECNVKCVPQDVADIEFCMSSCALSSDFAF